MIKLLIADNSVLVRVGFKALLSDVADFSFVAEAENALELKEINKTFKPDVLIVDTHSLILSNADLTLLKKANKKLQILAITQMLSKAEIENLLNGEVTSYLLKECDKQEIIDAIIETNKGERFLCGKIALCLSTHTVNTHRKNIMNKLGVNNTAGIVMYAVKNNILEHNPYLFSN